jgi:hypothetical protein
MKKSIKIVMGGLFALITSQVFAYEFFIINYCPDTEITAEIHYGGEPVFCQSHTVTIQKHPNHVFTQQTGGCCISKVIFRTKEGIPSSTEYIPPLTGAFLSCRDSNVKVQRAADGSLVATRVDDRNNPNPEFNQ